MKAVLFDLDGTLVDPKAGIVRCVRLALSALGAPPAADADLDWVIGPPIRKTFERLLGAPDAAARAVEIYRQHYRDGGLTEASVYPGVETALKALDASGYRLMVCTAKAQPFAEAVLTHFGLIHAFSAVYGPSLDGRFEDKRDLARHILEVEDLGETELCLVGDREHDMYAAAACGTPGVGALWGYGSSAELEAAGAAVLCGKPSDLPAACAGVSALPSKTGRSIEF